MTTPSNTKLQAIIAEATPGPWSNAAYTSPPSDDSEVKALTYERKAGRSIVHFNYIAEGMTSANAKLVALTPAIAAELITVRTDRDRLRDGIKALMRVCHIDAANRDQSRKPEEILILRDLEDRLRALLDGEAKG